MLGRQHPTLVVTSAVAGPGGSRDLLARHIGQELAWVQPSAWRSTWRLVAGDAELLRLDGEKWWRGTLLSELGGERIRFGPSLWRETAVRERDDAEVARLHRTGWRRDEDSERLGISRWWGIGRIEYGSRHRAWLRREPWKQRWQLLDPRGREIADLERPRRGFSIEGAVRLGAVSADTPELALLVTFGWWTVMREVARSRQHAH